MSEREKYIQDHRDSREKVEGEKKVELEGGAEAVEVKRSMMGEPIKVWTWAGLGGGAVMTVVAWVIYLIFAK